MQWKIQGNHLRCKVANKYLNVYEWVEVPEMNKDGALPTTDVLQIVSALERKHKLQKKHMNNKPKASKA